MFLWGFFSVRVVFQSAAVQCFLFCRLLAFFFWYSHSMVIAFHSAQLHFSVWWLTGFLSFCAITELGIPTVLGLKNFYFVYLAELGLSCGMRALHLSCSLWNLVSWWGVEPKPLVWGAWSLSHWTTRDIQGIPVLKSCNSSLQTKKNENLIPSFPWWNFLDSGYGTPPWKECHLFTSVFPSSLLLQPQPIGNPATDSYLISLVMNSRKPLDRYE